MEIVLDTHFLSELLKQFSFDNPNAELKKDGFLSNKTLSIINNIICNRDGQIIVSAFAFIEIINKIERISEKKFTISTVRRFIADPPEWMVIEPINLEVCEEFISIIKNTKIIKTVELADAIHVATAMARGNGTYLLTMDDTLLSLNIDSIIILS